MNASNFDELERQVEELFDKADNLMINLKNFQEAKQIYSSILEMDPDNIDALNSTATCIKNTSGPDQDFFPACLDLYQRALELDPEDFETNFNIGILYYTETPSNKKDALKAIHYLKIAIAEERSATVMFNLAVIYEEQGERGQAKEMYQEVSN